MHKQGSIRTTKDLVDLQGALTTQFRVMRLTRSFIHSEAPSQKTENPSRNILHESKSKRLKGFISLSRQINAEFSSGTGSIWADLSFRYIQVKTPTMIIVSY